MKTDNVKLKQETTVIRGNSWQRLDGFFPVITGLVILHWKCRLLCLKLVEILLFSTTQRMFVFVCEAATSYIKWDIISNSSKSDQKTTCCSYCQETYILIIGVPLEGCLHNG